VDIRREAAMAQWVPPAIYSSVPTYWKNFATALNARSNELRGW
jgi:hypothetical protein